MNNTLILVIILNVVMATILIIQRDSNIGAMLNYLATSALHNRHNPSLLLPLIPPGPHRA
jgi:hypothetical protein